jgi:hypothetical protein
MLIKKLIVTNPVIDLSDCANGVYILKMQSAQKSKVVLLVKK